MAKKETEKQKKVKQLLLELKNKDENTQLQAVKSLKVHGNETTIEPLVQTLIRTESGAIQEEIVDLLNTIKSTKVPEVIIACLGNEEYAQCRQILLSSIWNSGLDYRPYLGDIAAATVKGDFMVAMECITIIENIEGMLDEDQIMDALLVFKAYLVENRENESSKQELIKEIVMTLQNLNDTV